MGRVTIPDAATDGDPFAVDLSARGLSAEAELFDRSAPLGSVRPEPVGPEPAQQIPPNHSAQEAVVQPEISLHRLWFQLPEGDQQRFGTCFSVMLLKAIGHRC